MEYKMSSHYALFFFNLRSHSELTIPQIFMQYHEYLLTFYLQYESESVTYLSKSGLNKLTKFSFLCFFFFCFLFCKCICVP